MGVERGDEKGHSPRVGGKAWAPSWGPGPLQTDRLTHKRKPSAAAVKEAGGGRVYRHLEVYRANCIAWVFFCCAGQGSERGREGYRQGADVVARRVIRWGPQALQ